MTCVDAAIDLLSEEGVESDPPSGLAHKLHVIYAQVLSRRCRGRLGCICAGGSVLVPVILKFWSMLDVGLVTVGHGDLDLVVAFLIAQVGLRNPAAVSERQGDLGGLVVGLAGDGGFTLVRLSDS